MRANDQIWMLKVAFRALSYGTLFSFMIMAKILLYGQKWKDVQISTMEEWMMKMVEFVEMVKLQQTIENTFTNLISTWKSFFYFCDKLKEMKN